jgi:L-alanine-DL-glutamate epimerase-like enolase superfamily enzyme
MRLRTHLVRMRDKDVWRCAREEIPEHRAVLVELSAGGESGWGEASAFMTDVYNSETDTVVKRLGELDLDGLDPRQPEQTWYRLAHQLDDCPFALAALDVAAHDLAARLAGVPLFEHLGLPVPEGLPSSYSIGLDTVDVMVDKLNRTPGWGLYKVKLAKADDLHVLRALREHTDAPFWVDGNACWQPEALFEVLDELPGLGVIALEQPFAVTEIDGQLAARDRSPVPIFADESVTTPDQVRPAAGRFDGINVKVLKAGGLTPALAMLRECRELGVASMLGCLPESSAGASAAAHIARLADHVDLDTVALLDIDTGTGASLDDTGRIRLAGGTGTGFVPDWTSPAHEGNLR